MQRISSTKELRDKLSEVEYNSLLDLNELKNKLANNITGFVGEVVYFDIPNVVYEEESEDDPPSERKLHTWLSDEDSFYLDENVLIKAFVFKHDLKGYRSFLTFDQINHPKTPSEEELKAYFVAHPYKYLDEDFDYYMNFPEFMEEGDSFIEGAEIKKSSTLYYLDGTFKKFVEQRRSNEVHLGFGAIDSVNFVISYTEERAFVLYFTNPYLSGLH